MKIFLLFLMVCFAITDAQFYYDKHGECRGAYKDSLEHATLVGLAKRFHGPILLKKPVEGVKPRKNLEKIPENKIQRTFNVSRDTLDKENWLEVDKNEFVRICVDVPVVAWETSLKSSILNDSCLAFQIPIFTGVEAINVYFPESENSKKINLAVGMKYLKFENEEVLLGFNKYNETELYALGYKNNHDPERLVTITGIYLVDKYPVTNCDIIQTMWDNLPSKKTSFTNWNRKRLADEWVTRKRNSTRNGTCDVHDSAACTIMLFQAMKYANTRSTREGLKPYYTFSSSNKVDSRIISKGNYIIGYFDFTNKDEGKEEIQVSIDSTSDGYRLPFYDEWMMFARGGDKKKQAPWSDSATFEEASKYAQLGPEWHYDKSKPVGQLLPNGYGLYDMLGLVEEHVLFEEKNPFSAPRNKPSCVKGANDRTEQEWKSASKSSGPYWKDVNYGYYRGNNNEGLPAGFRLIRNIGNNAKWERKDSIVNDKSVDDLKNKELHTNDSFVNSEPDKDSVSDNEKLKERKVLDLKVSDVFIGRRQLGGYVGTVTPIFPIMDSIPVPWFRHYLSGSKLARAIKFKVEKNSLTRNRTMWVRISLVKEDGSLYDFNTSVDVEFYRIGEERDKYIFQSTKMFKDKAILFTRNEKDIGNFKEAVVLCIKKNSDKFAFQLLE